MRLHYDDLGSGVVSACGRLAEDGASLTTEPKDVECRSCARCIEGARSGGRGITCREDRPGAQPGDPGRQMASNGNSSGK